jgi:hypothetical protein
MAAGYRVADWTQLRLSSAYLRRFSSSSSSTYADLNIQLQANFVY